MSRGKTKAKHVSLGSFLQGARIRSNLSQWDVAKKLGYSSPQFISNFERGLSSPPLNILRILVGLYGIMPREILKVIALEQQRTMDLCLQEIKKALA